MCISYYLKDLRLANLPSKNSLLGTKLDWCIYPVIRVWDSLGKIVFMWFHNQRWSRCPSRRRPQGTLVELTPWTWATSWCKHQWCEASTCSCICLSLTKPSRALSAFAKSSWSLVGTVTLSFQSPRTCHGVWLIDGTWYLLDKGIYDFGILTSYRYFYHKSIYYNYLDYAT